MADDDVGARRPPYISYGALAEATESVLVAVHQIRNADGKRLPPGCLNVEAAFEEVRLLVVRLAKLDPEPVVYMPKPMVVSGGPLADVLRASSFYTQPNDCGPNVPLRLLGSG